MVFEVEFYNVSKGFGSLHSIEVGVPRIICFFHNRSVQDKINLQAGDVVTADVIPSKQKPGRLDAVNIVLRKRDEIAKAGQ